VGFLAGKRALIAGLASERSIAFGIAAAMRREGAELAFTYQNDRLKDRVVDMAQGFGAAHVLPMDVASDAEIETAFSTLRASWDSLDILVHSVAFAPREQLAGGFLDSVTREGFQVAHDISSYSLAALAKAARPMMVGRPGAILAMSYLGAVRSVPSYNVMGLAKASLEANVRFLAADLGPENIRVNGISAGPIKTLAAAGVSGFRKMLTHVAAATPLRRNVTIEEVGNVSAFLLSDLASGMTGEIIHVDCGFRSVAFGLAESPQAWVDVLPGTRHDVQLRTEWGWGATRIEDEGVITIVCDESP
jgi:enoyl-[acyl-carrier protein] reductase I